MKTAVFEYKCRRCGKVYDGCEMGVKNADAALINLLVTGNDGYPGIPIMLTDFHSRCKHKHELGVGDLIGFRIESQ